MKRFWITILCWLAVLGGGCLTGVSPDDYEMSYQIVDDGGNDDTWLVIDFPMLASVNKIAAVDGEVVDGCTEVVDFLEQTTQVLFKKLNDPAISTPEAESTDCFCIQQDGKERGNCTFRFLRETLTAALAEFDRIQLKVQPHRFAWKANPGSEGTLETIQSQWLSTANIHAENDDSQAAVEDARLEFAAAAQQEEADNNREENGNKVGFNPFPDLLGQEGAKNGGADSKKGGGFCQLHPGAKWGASSKEALIPIIFFIGMLLVWRVSKTDSQNSEN